MFSACCIQHALLDLSDSLSLTPCVYISAGSIFEVRLGTEGPGQPHTHYCEREAMWGRGHMSVCSGPMNKRGRA